MRSMTRSMHISTFCTIFGSVMFFSNTIFTLGKTMRLMDSSSMLSKTLPTATTAALCAIENFVLEGQISRIYNITNWKILVQFKYCLACHISGFYFNLQTTLNARVSSAGNCFRLALFQRCSGAKGKITFVGNKFEVATELLRRAIFVPQLIKKFLL